MRAFLQLAGVPPGDPPLTDDQVIPSEDTTADRGQRPPKPYATVLVLVDGIPEGMAHVRYDLTGGGAPQRTATKDEGATVSVQGFGPGSGDWLRRAVLGLYRADVQALNLANGLTILEHGGVRDLRIAVGTAFEARTLAEFEVQYRVAAEPETLVEMSEANLGLTFERSGDPSITLDGSTTITP
jgi:hypothetical protein